jgi:hypothetical protein
MDIWSLTYGTTPGGYARSPVVWVSIGVVVTAAFAAVSYGLVRGSRVGRGALFVLVGARLVLGAFSFPGFTSWWVLLWLGQSLLDAGTAALLLAPAARVWFAEAAPPNPAEAAR